MTIRDYADAPYRPADILPAVVTCPKCGDSYRPTLHSMTFHEHRGA